MSLQIPSKNSFLAVLLLAVLAISIFSPKTQAQSPTLIGTTLHEAAAWIQIRSIKPVLFGTDNGYPQDYEVFVQTQLAFMRHPEVISRVLEDNDVAKLPIILQQKDRRTWLTKNIRIARLNNSEIVEISIKTSNEDASEKIVNAVVDAYFNFIEEIERQTFATLLTQLQIEKRRQQQIAQALQDNIRAKTKEHAVKGTHQLVMSDQSDILLQEITSANIALIKLKAEREAITELLEQPNTDADELKEVIEALKINARKELWTLEHNIRKQEIVMEELRKAYTDQLVQIVERGENVMEFAFDHIQIARVNKTIDQIDDRILAIQFEARAPARIVPLTKAVSVLSR